MSKIKIDVTKLSSELGSIKILNNECSIGVKTYKIIQPVNIKGKTENKLVAVDKSYKKLSKSLGTLINSVDVFFTDAKDGIVDANEYTTKVMKNLG